jgi:hypothetical protein
MLIALFAAVTFAAPAFAHHSMDDESKPYSETTAEPPPSVNNTTPPPTGTFMPAQPNPEKKHHDRIKARKAAVTKPQASSTPSVLAPVKLNFLSVPALPGDPFTASPPANAMPMPMSANPQPMGAKPVPIEMGAQPLVQVNCVIPNGDYCVFANPVGVTPGSRCHCGSAVGITE